jgi:VanZ family protein
MASFLRWWGPLLVYMILLYWASARPVPEVLHRTPDYLMHFGAYFLMGILTVRAFARGLAGPVSGRLVGFSLFFSLAYALSDEWHQMYVPGREASFQDVLADDLGICASLGVLFLFWRLMSPPSEPGAEFRPT